MWLSNILLKPFYSFMLMGLPTVTYTPINQKSIFHVPVTIEDTSTYINYKIPKEYFSKIDKYIKKYTNDLSLIPTRLSDDEIDYFISINIYNCTSPIFNSITNEPVTRCEINTYVVNSKGEEGTLIMDYTSNFLSLDPVNIFKAREKCEFKRKKENYILNAKNKNFKLNSIFSRKDKGDMAKSLNKKLIAHTDNIFYVNGIYDKIYYDSSLIKSSVRFPSEIKEINFKFLDIKFNNPHSIFYFEDKLQFVGAIWANLYDI